MTEKKKEKTAESENPPEEDEKDVNVISIEDLKGHVRFIEKAVSTKEPRYISRVLRGLSSTRKKLNQVVLWRIVSLYFPHGSADKDFLLGFLDEPMETEAVVTMRPRSSRGGGLVPLPEVALYLHLLFVIHLIDSKRNDDTVKCVDALIEKVQSLSSRRSTYELSAKCYFYYGRAYEVVGRLHEIRSFLHSRLRTATLRRDMNGQATLLNLLLRNYLHYNLYDQAFKLHSKTDFPESASNNEWARYLYYLGRIQAIQLDYSSAQRNLLQATRKAPQQSAIGFKQMASKLSVTVQLLLGEIPDRSVFREPCLRKPLQPYLQLVQAVRMGDLSKFGAVVEEYREQFKRDHTYTLILRLHHNVIKTGVRMISLSYSRISLVDVAEKLQLDSPMEAEFIVAKAIKDGVIEATIDHDNGFVQSKENVDIYSTAEPQTAFHQRITFCLELHNQCVKAMRFPPKSYNKDLESVEVRREREQQDLEFAKELAEDDDDGFP